MKLTEGEKKKEQGSIHYQVMGSDERESAGEKADRDLTVHI